jgi:NADH dehydrogenase FAD-containing subunit
MAKRVVIIGAGPTGVTVANGLAPSAEKGSVEITILTRSDHLDVCLGQPRALVNPAFAEEALPTLDRVLHGSKKPRVVAVADITAVGGGGVSYTTRDGGSETVTADAIVIATGSRYKGKYIKNNDGLPKQEWTKRMDEWRAAAAKAKHIVVVGAGVTGIEVAGELATEHPQVPLLSLSVLICLSRSCFSVRPFLLLTRTRSFSTGCCRARSRSCTGASTWAKFTRNSTTRWFHASSP